MTDAHRARLRRANRVYLPVVAVLVLLAVGFAVVTYRRGEQVHVHSTVATRAAAETDVRPLATVLQRRWHSSDAAALGSPVVGGVVVTWAGHTVTGRDATTGDALWSFTRTDRTVCSVTRISNRALALFRHAGNCDEVDALDATTGARAWNRTLFENGLALNGDANVVATPDTWFVWNRGAVFAISVSDDACLTPDGPNCGADVWTFGAPPQCAFTSLAVGGIGALMGEQCADGAHLALGERYVADGKNHMIRWTTPVLPGPEVAVAAEEIVAAVSTDDGTLHGYDAATGSGGATLALFDGPVRGRIDAADDAGLLVNADGRTVAVSSAVMLSWSARTPALPVVASDSGLLATSTKSGIATLSETTGRSTQTWTPTDPPQPGARLVRFGDGFLAAGTSTDVYLSAP